MSLKSDAFDMAKLSPAHLSFGIRETALFGGPHTRVCRSIVNPDDEPDAVSKGEIHGGHVACNFGASTACRTAKCCDLTVPASVG